MIFWWAIVLKGGAAATQENTAFLFGKNCEGAAVGEASLVSCQAWLGGPEWATGRLGDLLYVSLYVRYTFRIRYQAGPPKLAHLALKLAFVRSHT